MNKILYLVPILFSFCMIGSVFAIQFSHYGDMQNSDPQSTNQGYNNLEISMLYNQTKSLNQLVHNQQQEIDDLNKIVQELKK